MADPTDAAKQRSSHLHRTGARPMSPEQRQSMGGEPGAVQGAQAPQMPQMPGGLQPNPPTDRPTARSKGEINADLQAYSDALEQHRQAEEEKEEESEEPKKKKDEYVDDDGAYEALWGDNDKLNNKARRKRIEARCKPMSLEDYIMNGGVKQVVPIIPGKIVPTFRSASVDEDLEVKRMMFGVQGTDIYIANRFSLMQLTLSLFAFNGEPLPDHLNRDGQFDEDLFNKKFEKVRKYPTQLAEDLVNNYMWFDDRVKDLFGEDLGNG